MLFVCYSHFNHMSSYVIRMSFVWTSMSSVCHSYVFVCHPYVTRMYSYVIRMSLVCTRMSSVYHSYVIRMSFVCTYISSVWYSYAIVCHPYVTCMHSYVIRMSLACTRMPFVFHFMWFYHESENPKELSILKKSDCSVEVSLWKSNYSEEITATKHYCSEKRAPQTKAAALKM